MNHNISQNFRNSLSKKTKKKQKNKKKKKERKCSVWQW